MARTLNPGLLAILILVILGSLQLGSVTVPVLTGLADAVRGIDSSAALIIVDIRLPRTLLAVAVGAALALSGAALQGLLRNILADPALLGASQGAALGAAGVFYFGLFSALGSFALALAGLLGAAISLALILLLAGSGAPALMIMAGLAIATLSSALLAVVLNYAPNPFAMQELVFWLLGSVAHRGLQEVAVVGVALLIGGLLLWRQRHLLAALSLGDQVARSMGFNVDRGSRLVVLATAILVGAAVAVAGSIGFVGLLVPHLLRPLVGHHPQRLLLPSALAGGILVCLADMAVRLMPGGQELKLGVLTSLLGAPLFFWLVWQERRRWP